MLISRKVTEFSEISHVNLRAGWKELTKPINRSNSSLVQDVSPKKNWNDLSVLSTLLSTQRFIGFVNSFHPHKFIINYLNTDLPTIPQSAPTKG